MTPLSGGAENEALNENQNKETVSNDIVRWNVGGVMVNDAPSGGGEGISAEPFVITGTTGKSPTAGSVDKTDAEIIDAIQAGKQVCFRLVTVQDDQQISMICMLISYALSSTTNIFQFVYGNSKIDVKNGTFSAY